jgi:hypothetical protein
MSKIRWLNFLRPFFARPKPTPRVHRPPLTVAERRAGIRLPDDIDQVNTWPEPRRPKWLGRNDRARWRGEPRRPPWGQL